MIKLVCIDDHQLFAEGLNSLIAKEKDILLLESYRQVENMASIIRKHRPDIILLDIYLSDRSGISLAKEVKAFYPDTKIIMLSMEVNPVFSEELQQIGVEAYISKEISAEDLCAIIRMIYNGDSFWEGSTRKNTIIQIAAGAYNLTDREIEIYRYILMGKSSKEIAATLNRSVLTIKTHRKNIKNKIRIHGDIDNTYL